MSAMSRTLGRVGMGGFRRRWVSLAVLAALAVVLSVWGGQHHGAQAEASLAVAADHGEARPAGVARFEADTDVETSVAAADEEDDGLGEAYRPAATFIGARSVEMEWTGSTTSHGGKRIPWCTVMYGPQQWYSKFGGEWNSYWMPRLRPNTDYQLWLECEVVSEDGSSSIKAGPKLEVTTLDPSVFTAQDWGVVDVGWHTATIRWKKPEAAPECWPILDGGRYPISTETRMAANVEYQFDFGIEPRGSYQVQVDCGMYPFERNFTDPVTVTARSLLSLSNFEATKKLEDRIRVRWDELEEAESYMVAFMPNARKGTVCGSGDTGRTGAWRPAKAQHKHVQAGLQPGTRYKVCLKAIGPEDEAISYVASIFVRTKGESR